MKKKMTLWGLTIRTDTHGEDVDAAAADDAYISPDVQDSTDVPISLRTITSMTLAKRLPVVLWTYKS